MKRFALALAFIVMPGLLYSAGEEEETSGVCDPGQMCAATGICGGECPSYSYCTYSSSCGDVDCSFECPDGYIQQSDCTCAPSDDQAECLPNQYSNNGGCYDCPMPAGTIGCVVTGGNGPGSCVLSTDPNFDGACTMSDSTGTFEITGPCSYDSGENEEDTTAETAE